MTKTILLLAALCTLFLQSPAQATIYKWVDANGTISFRDTPPPAGTKASIVTSGPLNVVDSPTSSNNSSAGTNSRITQPSPRNASVDLYTTSWCGYCRKARAFFQAKGVAFREYDVEKDAAAAKRKEQLGGGSGVPFAVINGKKISGFSEGAYASALGL